MHEGPFEIDQKSYDLASKLARNLADAHRYWLHQFNTNVQQHFYIDEAVASATRFSEGLSTIGREVPMHDVKADVEDFGKLSAYADELGGQLPVIKIHSSVPPIPLLPAHHSKFFDEVRDSGSFEAARTTFEDLMLMRSEGGHCELRPAEQVRRSFFDNIRGFLAARIAGVRWAQSTGRASSGRQLLVSSGAGGGFEEAGDDEEALDEDDGKREYQKWEVHTKGEELSIYYAGTHACRKEAIYLNAPTSPVDVYLPMGTVYLAANAGPGGDYVWDEAIIIVPHETPTFYSKAF